MNLVRSVSSLGSGDWSPPGPHLDLVNPVATCASPGPCDSGPTWTSPGSGGSGSHMGLSWTWFLWSPSGINWNKMTLIHIWASAGPVYSGPYLGIIGTWILLYTWASPGPVDCGPTWASPGRSDWFPQGPHLDLVTQVLIWASWDLVSQFHIGASPGPSDSRPALGLSLTW